MKILIVPNFTGLTHPKTGGQNRILNLAVELKKQGHEIQVLEEKDHLNEADTLLATNVYIYSDFRILRRKFPVLRDFSISYIWNMTKLIKSGAPDMLYFSHPSGVFITYLLKKIFSKDFLIWYDAHNVESFFVREVIKDVLSPIERMILKKYIRVIENLALRLSDVVSAVSHKDKKMFFDVYGGLENIAVIPSGSEVGELGDCMDRRKVNSGIVVVFHGSYSHPPNKEAIEIIKDYVSKGIELKNVIFRVGGTGVPEFEEKNCKSEGYIKNMKEFLCSADLAILPLKRGGGTKLKFFDYLAYGLPVVATEVGAEGIELKNKVHAVVLRGVDEKFIKEIENLVLNPKIRKKLGYNGKKLLERKYEWNVIGSALSRILGNIE
jgi:glycosyltransferase involved in cell wall biosynthesis